MGRGCGGELIPSDGNAEACPTRHAARAAARVRAGQRSKLPTAGITRLNPEAARSVAAAIAGARRIISEQPRIGRLQKGRDLRKLVVPRYADLTFYRVLDRAHLVAIVTIRHPARARIVPDA